MPCIRVFGIPRHRKLTNGFCRGIEVKKGLVQIDSSGIAGIKEYLENEIVRFAGMEIICK